MADKKLPGVGDRIDLSETKPLGVGDRINLSETTPLQQPATAPSSYGVGDALSNLGGAFSDAAMAIPNQVGQTYDTLSHASGGNPFGLMANPMMALPLAGGQAIADEGHRMANQSVPQSLADLSGAGLGALGMAQPETMPYTIPAQAALRNFANQSDQERGLAPQKSDLQNLSDFGRESLAGGLMYQGAKGTSTLLDKYMQRGMEGYQSAVQQEAAAKATEATVGLKQVIQSLDPTVQDLSISTSKPITHSIEELAGQNYFDGLKTGDELQTKIGDDIGSYEGEGRVSGELQKVSTALTQKEADLLKAPPVDTQGRPLIRQLTWADASKALAEARYSSFGGQVNSEGVQIAGDSTIPARGDYFDNQLSMQKGSAIHAAVKDLVQSGTVPKSVIPKELQGDSPDIVNAEPLYRRTLGAMRKVITDKIGELRLYEKFGVEGRTLEAEGAQLDNTLAPIDKLLNNPDLTFDQIYKFQKASDQAAADAYKALNAGNLDAPWKAEVSRIIGDTWRNLTKERATKIGTAANDTADSEAFLGFKGLYENLSNIRPGVDRLVRASSEDIAAKTPGSLPSPEVEAIKNVLTGGVVRGGLRTAFSKFGSQPVPAPPPSQLFREGVQNITSSGAPSSLEAPDFKYAQSLQAAAQAAQLAVPALVQPLPRSVDAYFQDETKQ